MPYAYVHRTMLSTASPNHKYRIQIFVHHEPQCASSGHAYRKIALDTLDMRPVWSVCVDLRAISSL